MVAGNNKNGNACFRLKLFKSFGKSLVAFKFAVFGKVAGNKNIGFAVLACVAENAVKCVVKK